MARHIPDDVLETIRMRADVVDLVQSYVPTLKKAGATWKACCPFHQEKTPSFVVNPARGIYKCFGCGKGGNVFSFVMEMEKLDFPNAAEFLARKYNVIIPDAPRRGRENGGSSKPEADYSVRERLYVLHEKLASWYSKQLFSNPDSAVAKYFLTRKLPRETADRFQLGASPDSWDSAIRYLKGEGFSDKELLLSGVVSRKEETSDHIYDRFRNRLMFPIWNEQGRIIAFSARSVEADPQGWKYVNSPESPVFRKSRTLYALHFARQSIAAKGCAVLCEGQLDVIAMHRAGCTNAVAPQGTAFGEEQAGILRRYTQCICLALDSDKAGRAAIFKDAAILLPHGFTLKVAVLPGAKDADELIKTEGPEAVRNAVENARDFFEFALQSVSEGRDMSSPAGKAEAARELSQFLFKIDNPVTLDLYASWLAQTLGVDKSAVLTEVGDFHKKEDLRAEQAEHFAAENRPRDPQPSAAPATPAAPVRKNLSDGHPGVRKAYLELLEVLLNSEECAALAVNGISADMLDETPAGRSIEIVIQAKMNEEWSEAPARIMMMLTGENLSEPKISELLLPPPEPEQAESAPGTDATAPGLMENTFLSASPSPKKYREIYRGCLRVIARTALSAKRREIVEKAAALPDGSEEKLAAFREVTELTKKLLNF